MGFFFFIIIARFWRYDVGCREVFCLGVRCVEDFLGIFFFLIKSRFR